MNEGIDIFTVLSIYISPLNSGIMLENASGPCKAWPMSFYRKYIFSSDSLDTVSLILSFLTDRQCLGIMLVSPPAGLTNLGGFCLYIRLHPVHRGAFPVLCPPWCHHGLRWFRLKYLKKIFNTERWSFWI